MKKHKQLKIKDVGNIFHQSLKAIKKRLEQGFEPLLEPPKHQILLQRKLFYNIALASLIFTFSTRFSGKNKGCCFPSQKERQEYYEELIEKGVDEEIASLVFSNKFKVYPKRKASSKKLTYEDYERLLNIEKKAKIAYEVLEKHGELLQRIGEKYGIKPLYLASLLAVETSGGSFLGRYQMFNALFSRYFNSTSPKWKTFYLNEIKALKDLEGYDMFAPSSFAGAIGITQFMPSNILKYGVDFDKDGVVEMFELEDAIASAANYLALHGGREDIERAYFHYNGHEWFARALMKINKKVLEMLSENKPISEVE